MIAIYPDLKDKIVLVTGASRGIGKSIAKSLAKQGAHVALNFRVGKEEEAAKLQKECEEFGGKGTPVFFDLTNGQQTKEAIDNFINEFGAIAGLVNNAAISVNQLVLRLKEDDLNRIIDTNLKGTISLTALLSRNFLKATNVSIVNISSIVGLMGNTSQSIYSASKAGLIGFTKSFAKEFGSKNIRCNAVCPGFIDTDMTQTLDDKVKEAYLAQIPLKRWGDTRDIAQLTCFLISQASSYITGEVIKIDGGLYI